MGLDPIRPCQIAKFLISHPIICLKSKTNTTRPT